MQRISPYIVIIDLGRIDEFGIVLRCHKRVREIAEELLEKSSNTVDIVEERLGVSEIDLG